MDEKNPLGFTHKQLEIVLDYCRKTRINPRMSYSEFHRKNGSYSRKQSTIDLLNRAYENLVILGPRLFCNRGLEVTLVKTDRNPHELIKEIKRENKKYKEQYKKNKYTYAIALSGEWSLMSIKLGASILEHIDTPIPTFPSNYSVEDLMFDQRGLLSRDPYPRFEDELDMQVYELMQSPRKTTFKEAGEELNIPWTTIQYRFKKILKQCKILSCFLPLGYNGYQYGVYTFKTKYEIGLHKTLKNLDRTSYIYKFNGTILLILFLDPGPLSINKVNDRFQHLEEIGIIHDLRISIPTRWWKPNYDFPD